MAEIDSYEYSVPGYRERLAGSGPYLDDPFVEDPGAELGYAQNEASFSTNNTVVGAAAGKVPGLVLTITGTGRPVDIEFYAMVYLNAGSTVPAWVQVDVLEDGVSAADLNAAGRNYYTVAGLSQLKTMFVTMRKVLARGKEYTFEIGITTSAAGSTAVVFGDANTPSTVKATVR